MADEAESSSKSLKESIRPVTDAGKVRSIIEEAVLTGAKLQLMNPKGKLYSGTFKKLESGRIEFSIKALDETRDLIEHLQKLKEDEVFETSFQVILRNSATFLFKTRLHLEGTNTFWIKPPEKIFSVQRRKHFRYTIPKAYEIYVEMGNPRQPKSKIRMKLIDISIGGCCLECPHAYASSFKAKSNIRFDLLMSQQRIALNGEVRIVRKPERSVVSFLGIEFAHLEPASKDFVETYLKEKLVQLQSGALALYEGDFFDALKDAEKKPTT